MVRYCFPLYSVGWFAKYGHFNRWYLDMSSNLGLVLSFGTTSWCTKTWGDPPLDCMCIYISLHNVNIVWLPDANSIGTKNLKGVDSLGFPGSARRHATCTMSSINRVSVYEFLRVNKQTLTWQQFGWTIRGDKKKKAGLYDAIIS